MSYDPSPKQEEAIGYLMDVETIYVGYGGAAFGGKSYLLCKWITTMSLAYPGTGWGIGRRQLTVLLKTTVVTLYKVFKEMGLRGGVHYTYNGQLRVFTFNNGSEIFLIDMAYRPIDPLFTRFGGYELTGAAVDESVEVDELAIETLFTRLGRRLNFEYGLKRKLLETFNPAKNHVYRRYYRPHKDNRLPKEYKFIKALPKDNPSPEVKDYIDGIVATASDVTIQRLIYGNFEYEDDPTILMSYASTLDLFSNYWVKKSRFLSQRYITADIALQGSDRFVIFVWFGWVIVDIIVLNKSGGRQVIEKIKEVMKKYKVRASNVVYDRDGVGGFIGGRGGYLPGAHGFVNNASPIERVDHEKRAGKKAKAKEIETQYENLKAQCGYEMAKLVNKRAILIAMQMLNQEEERLIEDIGQIRRRDIEEEGKLKLKRKKKIIKDIGRSPDYGDAFLMRYYFELIPKARARQVKSF